MPLKDDFLTRAVEQMAKTVVTVTTLKERAQFDEALSEVNRAYRANTGSGREIIHLLPSEQLIDLLGSSGVVDAEKCLLIAELLRVETEVLEARDGEAPPALLLKSLDLLLEALLAEDTLLPDYAARVEFLEKALEDYSLPPSTERRLFEFYALQGAYAEAEDWLFRLLEGSGSDPELLARGRRFYGALLAQSDELLEQGGLPRNEVEEGLAALEGRDAPV